METAIGLRTGNVVTDISPSSKLNGEQGQVVDVQFCFWGSPEVIVRFDEDTYAQHLPFEDGEFPGWTYGIYRIEELRRDDNWKPETYANRLFGIRWHSISMLEAPMNPEALCMVKDCPCKQSEVVWVNLWGTVVNAYVCEDHARYFRTNSCIDSFPWRTPPEEASE